MRDFIKCQCGAHGIGIEHEVTVATKEMSVVETYLSYWIYGKWNMDLKDKIRYCWHILTTGNVYADMICLDSIDRKRLVIALLKADELGDMAIRNYEMPE